VRARRRWSAHFAKRESRMALVIEKATALTTDARGSDFDDIAHQVDALRQQLVAADQKIGGLERILGGS